jgi:hypothetical protein
MDCRNQYKLATERYHDVTIGTASRSMARTARRALTCNGGHHVSLAACFSARNRAIPLQIHVKPNRPQLLRSLEKCVIRAPFGKCWKNTSRSSTDQLVETSRTEHVEGTLSGNV